MRGPLFREVRQSLGLFALSALSMGLYVGIGLIAIRFFG
jgi:hypothetical protein